MSYVGLGERKTYICNPYKHKTCKKTICGILNNCDISEPHCCFITTHKEYRLDPSDPDLEKFAFNRDRIEKWVKQYYGKEDEANGPKILP